MELEEAFRILEGDKELQYKYGNDSDGCINPQIAIDEAILAIQNYINFEVIPKKKIEDVKSKYETKYKKHKEVADKQFEKVGTRDCFDNELAIRDLGAIRVCEELLEDK